MGLTPCELEFANGIHIVEESTAIDKENNESWTFVFFWDEGNFYFTTVTIPPEEIHEGNARNLTPIHHIPLDRIYPTNLTGVTLASPQASAQAFVKTPNFSVYYPGRPYKVADRFLHKIHVLEALSKYPHPNIVKYFGCIVGNGRIQGICLEKCVGSLDERVQSEDKRIDKDHVIDRVRSAVTHMHRLGYCHNDISPYNIMLREDDSVVLIDFDTCQPTTHKIDKRGTYGFCDPEATISRPENDLYSIAKLEEYLSAGGNSEVT